MELTFYFEYSGVNASEQKQKHATNFKPISNWTPIFRPLARKYIT